MTEVVVALDVGGTKAHGALIDRQWRIVIQHTAATVGRDQGLVATRSVAERLFRLAQRGEHEVHGFVAGFPEYVSNEGVITARDVLDWTVQPSAALTVDPSVPARIRSDVKCGARGELELGRGQECADFAYISLGTGLSSTMVLGGKLHEGARGEAIGFGEWAVSGAIEPGWTGNLEQYASGTGIAARYAQLTGSQGVVDGARGVLAAAERGDPIAAAVADTAGRAIGRALAQLISVFDLPMIVLAGGLGTAETRVTRALRAEYVSAAATRPDPPALVSSAVPANPGLLGAAVYAWEYDPTQEAHP